MAPEEDVKKRMARKFARRRKEVHQVTMDIPERFQDGDDADEDCTAPQGSSPFLNQSVFGMIAAAGSQVDFNARFDGQSSEEEEDDDSLPTPQNSNLPLGKTREEQATENKEKNRRKLSENKLLRSIPRLGLKMKSNRSSLDHTSPIPQSPAYSIPPDIQVSTSTPLLGDAPVMERMLEAKAELSMRPSFEMPRSSEDSTKPEDKDKTQTSSLAKRLAAIFHFESPEDVISEYPCWLLKSVLLSGYMYITAKHICFYAYLPKKSNEVVKSGYLSKSGRRNPKYHRYWFRLKGDVLSYYADQSNLYFPSGNIDLRYGISANVSDKKKSDDATQFTVVTHQRNYHFKADSAPSAKEWVKALQKIIFRSHNDGDSVKISLPIENIIDIEDSQIVDFADTCKIRVIDNDETYAIDEYFFSFFSFGKQALKVLKILVEDTTAQQIPESVLNSQINDALIARQNDPKSPSKLMIPSQKKWPPSLEDDVRATLSPLLSPRPGNQSPNINADASRTSSTDMRRSVDLNRIGRRSMDVNKFGRDGVGRRSASGTRHRSRSRMRASSGSRIRSKSRTRFQVGEEAQRSEQQGSSDSYVQSMDDPTSSCVLPLSSEASASQILRDSDVFKTPTIQRSMSVHLSRQPSAQESLTKPPEPSSESASRVERPQPERANTINTLSSTNTGPAESSVSVNTFQNIVKAGSYPLQRAAGLAGYINKHSKRMSNLLATESMGYVEKVSGMWKGGKKHYDEPQELVPDDGMDEDEDDTSGDRFRDHFALPFNEKLQATYFGYLHRVLPLYGKIYISDRSFCFRSLLPGTRTKLILPLKDIENVDKEKGFRFGYSGLVVVIKGHEELFFEFGQAISRDDCAITLLQSLEATRFLKESGLLSMEEKEKAENASAEHRALLEARSEVYSEHDTKLPRSSDVQDGAPPIIFDDPRASILNFKPQESLTVTCLTIGSRGDVQPYIALCKGLLAEGHKPRIATHAEFKDWIERHGIEFAPVEGDPAELMRICVDNGTFTYSFFREVSTKFRGWLDGLMTSAWKACQGSDVVIEGPSAMAGIHIAEALRIPYFRAFSMPWTRTRAYPHAFAVPEHKMGGAYNYLTYVMFDNVFWKAMAGQVNRWRKKELGLQPTSLEKMQPNKIPFLYSFSPSVVIPPLDWSDWIRVTGYWFLDEGTNWNPPRELADFIQKARDDGKKLVYVGFGSIVVQDSAALMNTIIKSVLKADVRCILSKGWSDRLEKKGSFDIEMLSPPEIYQIKAAPHDWLFAQIDAAVHHGGSGTTGASLRAGLPTIIKPFFGDQFFFGNRVEDLGVGIILKKINLSVLSRALWEACHSERMIVKARVLGELIRKENGVDTAIQSIYRDMEYAKSLIKTRDGKTADDALEESEESWTFIGDDNDPELVRRIHDFESGAQSPKTSTESDTGASKRIESGSVAS